MASVTLEIPSPILTGIETFTVVVKDGGGMTVFSGSETNAAFVVSGLTGGDYTMFTTFGTTVDSWCFTVPPCGCPPLVSAVIDQITTGLYKAVFTFDFSAYTPDYGCAFVIYINMPDGSGFIYAITTTAALTDIGGGLFELTALILSNTSCTFYINQWVRGADNGINCTPTTIINYACGGPLLIAPTITLHADNTTRVITATIDYSTCGSGCHTVVWNYLEQSIIHGGTIGIPHSGGFTDTVTCSPLGITTHTLGTARTGEQNYFYVFAGTDCCGNTISINVKCIPAAIYPTYFPLASTISETVTITYPSCQSGATCFGITVAYQQTDGVSGNDSGTFSDTIPCGSLPYISSHLLNPQPNGGGDYNYTFTFNTCCGGGYSGTQAIGILR